jgi:two-component system chemotaxis sensor kinase CheA
MIGDDVTDTFLQEAQELLAELELAVLELERGSEIGEGVHRLFRMFHTLKGAAGAAGFVDIANLSHDVESLLDHVRDGRLELSRPLVDLVLEARDLLTQMLAPITGGSEPDAALRARIATKLLELSAERSLPPPAQGVVFFSDPPAPSDGAGLFDVVSPDATIPCAADGGLARRCFRISFTPDPELLTRSCDPAAVLDDLRAIGECTVEARLDRVPTLESLAAERCYLGFEILLVTDREADSVRDVFAFVENDSVIVIEPAEDSRETAPTAPREPARVETTRAQPQQIAPATVRVASEKLDRLVKLVGELVINQARLSQLARGSGGEMLSPVEELERLVGEMRDSVLGMRMLPIGATFNRFRRLVRDLSSELGKDVELVIEGEETELDKSVIEQLAEPLVHLIRNSIDHGIEEPDVRRRAQKPARGTLRLTAAHEGAQVVVTIADDGGGLDAEAIRARAIERGLVSAGATLSTDEIHDLIFAPGFSTAARVTNVSGRGVGMDVVKRQLESLRGSVTVASTRGKGTTIRLTLPLTLAIIDGLLVEVSGERFVIPLAAVWENVELSAPERARNNGRNAIAIRGELVPFLSLAEEFAFEPSDLAVTRVVVVKHAGARIGLLVDRILGAHQAVIQSLGRTAGRVKVVSGATILGDGHVALILDVAALLELGARPASRTSTARQMQRSL